jgi:hypothetical protein
MGDGLRRAMRAAKATRDDGQDAYVVVCADKEITGKFGNPLSIVQEQAIGMNVNCECGGPHRIIRMVQAGAGREIR